MTVTGLTAALAGTEGGGPPSGIALSATVTGSPWFGVPSGMVYFYDGEALVGMSMVSNAGTATCTTGTPAAGMHAMTAVYQGDQATLGSTSEVATVEVTKDATVTTLDVLTTWPDNYVELPGVVLTATVAPQAGQDTPTGTVTFTDGRLSLGTVSLVGGVATLSIDRLPIGDHPFVANYNGDGRYMPSQSMPLVQYVNQSELTLDPTNAPQAPPAPPTSATLTWDDFTTFEDSATPRPLPEGINAVSAWNDICQYTYGGKRTIAGNDKDGYTLKYEAVMKTSEYNVVFSRKDSKIADAFLIFPNLLEHERLHLAIAEYIAKRAKANEPAYKFKGEFAGKTKELVINNSDADLARKAKEAVAYYAEVLWRNRDLLIQDKYDDETSHGKIDLKQADWKANYIQYADDFLKASGWLK